MLTTSNSLKKLPLEKALRYRGKEFTDLINSSKWAGRIYCKKMCKFWSLDDIAHYIIDVLQVERGIIYIAYKRIETDKIYIEYLDELIGHPFKKLIKDKIKNKFFVLGSPTDYIEYKN